MSKILDAVKVANTVYDATVRAEMITLSRQGLILYIDYAKGDEASVEMMLETSNKSDVDGSEVWFQETFDSTANPTVVALRERQFGATGKYRFAIACSPSDDKVRLSFKRTGGTALGAGTITAYLS